jgi:hypothetical protein
MSTLDVTCSQCEKKFRVRAEFAGKTTRCPGCSAPITIAGSAPPPPPSWPRSEEPPRRRPRRRDDEDDEPPRPKGDWVPVDMAFRREQVAVVFVLIGIVCDYFAYCLTSAMQPGAGRMDEGAIAIVLLFVIGPSLAAAAFGLMARVAALKTPPESRAKGSAVASLLCGLGGLGCLIMMAFSMMIGFDMQRSTEVPMTIAIAGLVLSTLGSVATFVGFVAQVGIARRSAAVSEAVGRTSTGIAVCVLVILGIAVFYTLMSELTANPNLPNYGSSRYGEHEVFFRIMFMFLFPLSIGVILVLYHRMLAAGRRALQGEPSGRYDG